MLASFCSTAMQQQRSNRPALSRPEQGRGVGLLFGDGQREHGLRRPNGFDGRGLRGRRLRYRRT
jgi:hypothetical protein